MSSIQNGLKGITIASLYLFLVSDFDSHIDWVSMTMISLRESLYSYIYLVNGDVTESDSCIKPASLGLQMTLACLLTAVKLCTQIKILPT